MDMEFSVDPLFKKVAADFDEGGAKGLLLNHLAIDGTGRIVFDSSDDIEDTTADAESGQNQGEQTADDEDGANAAETEGAPAQPEQVKADIDIHALGTKFFPDLSRLEEQDICPSLKNFDLGDPAGSLDIPFLRGLEDRRQQTNNSQVGGLGDQTGVFLDEDNAAGFEDDDGVLGGFDLDADAGFGEGGEAWAKSAALEAQTRVHEIGLGGEAGEGQKDGVGFVGVGDFEPGNNQYAVSMHHQKDQDRHEDILSYFDNALQKNWAGPEHWRIRRIKDLNKDATPAPSRRKEKEPFRIDFNSPLDTALAEMLYAPPASTSAITLPKTQWKSKTRNLLPDDKHFHSRQLLRLFLKPKARIGSRQSGAGGLVSRQPQRTDELDGEMDEAFWARKENDVNQGSPDEEGARGDYDANFFQDDGLGFPSGPPDDEDEFADAREMFSPGAENGTAEGQESEGPRPGPEGSQEGAFGTQLVTQSRRLRPEYVQYARVAKKVDVRKLKEEMWKGIGFEDVSAALNILIWTIEADQHTGWSA